MPAPFRIVSVRFVDPVYRFLVELVRNGKFVSISEAVRVLMYLGIASLYGKEKLYEVFEDVLSALDDSRRSRTYDTVVFREISMTKRMLEEGEGGGEAGR